MTSSKTDDEGSVTLLTLAVAMALMLLVPIAGSVATAVAAKHRIDATADLAALAAAADVGVVDPCPTAARIAEANGGRVVGCEVAGSAVTIIVEPQVTPPGLPFRLASTARAAVE